jgi:hypothetical protein
MFFFSILILSPKRMHSRFTFFNEMFILEEVKLYFSIYLSTSTVYTSFHL